MKFIIYSSASKHMRLLQTVFTLLVKFFHYNSLWVSIRIDRLIKVGMTSDVGREVPEAKPGGYQCTRDTGNED